MQIYAQLLDDCVYLCSVSTMYRVLGQNTLVAERRRLARHPRRCAEQVFKVHGVPQVVHADRGTSMTSKTVADLEVTRSHSRPRVSNDNPYSESLFKTLKYGPEFPERFGSLCEARQFMDNFTNWYNHEHRFLGLGYRTPVEYAAACRCTHTPVACEIN